MKALAACHAFHPSFPLISSGIEMRHATQVTKIADRTPNVVTNKVMAVSSGAHIGDCADVFRTGGNEGLRSRDSRRENPEYCSRRCISKVWVHLNSFFLLVTWPSFSQSVSPNSLSVASGRSS